MSEVLFVFDRRDCFNLQAGQVVGIGKAYIICKLILYKLCNDPGHSQKGCENGDIG